MKTKFIYKLILFLVFLIKPVGFIHGQGDSNYYSIVFDCKLIIDSKPQGGFFYDISVTYDNYKYYLFPMSDRTEKDTIIILPLEASLNDSWKNQTFDFTMYMSNCRANRITYTIDSTRSELNRLYISSFNVDLYSVQYPSFLCSDSDPISPVSDLSYSNIMFSAQEGLTIGTDGKIDPRSSIPGTYAVQMNSAYCLESTVDTIKIITPPEFEVVETQECDRSRLRIMSDNSNNETIQWSDSTRGIEAEVFESKIVGLTVTNNYGCETSGSYNVEVKKLEFQTQVVEKQESDCWVDGKVNIQNTSVINNVGDFKYQLRNTLNNFIIDHFDDVPEGIYDLQVIDSRNCVAVASEKITIIQKCLEDYPVFSPNNDGLEDNYFIPYEGKIKIYDSENHLVKELVTPAYWDGNDQNGNSLPMGNYVMLTDQGKPVNITIVR